LYIQNRRTVSSTAGFLNLWATEEFEGPPPCITEIEYVLQGEPLIENVVVSELTGSAFALIVAHVVLLNGFSCFHFDLAYGRQLSHWRSCTVGGPQTVCLFTNWATCLKR